jgi:hypothetical protein
LSTISPSSFKSHQSPDDDDNEEEEEEESTLEGLKDVKKPTMKSLEQLLEESMKSFTAFLGVDEWKTQVPWYPWQPTGGIVKSLIDCFEVCDWKQLMQNLESFMARHNLAYSYSMKEPNKPSKTICST